MPKKENKTVASPHDQLLERASSRYPDRRFRGQIGQDGQEGQDDLEQAIIEMLSESDSCIAENESKNAALVKMFESDPKSTEFVQRWVRSNDPRIALVETFGDELADLATEEGRGKFADSLKSWRDKRAENDRLNEEAQANWQNSLAALEQWGNEKGLDNDKKVEVILRLIKVASDALTNIYSPADFDMVFKEMNYDADVAAARNEGEIAGRNQRIAENRRARTAVGAMPPSLNGQGIRGEEKQPEKEPESIWSGIK